MHRTVGLSSASDVAVSTCYTQRFGTPSCNRLHRPVPVYQPARAGRHPVGRTVGMWPHHGRRTVGCFVAFWIISRQPSSHTRYRLGLVGSTRLTRVVAEVDTLMRQPAHSNTRSTRRPQPLSGQSFRPMRRPVQSSALIWVPRAGPRSAVSACRSGFHLDEPPWRTRFTHRAQHTAAEPPSF